MHVENICELRVDGHTSRALSHKKYRIDAQHSLGRHKEETAGLLWQVENCLIARKTAIAATVGSRRPLFSDPVDAR